MCSELTVNAKKKTRWRRPVVIPCCLNRKVIISLLVTGKHVLHVILHIYGIVLLFVGDILRFTRNLNFLQFFLLLIVINCNKDAFEIHFTCLNCRFILLILAGLYCICLFLEV